MSESLMQKLGVQKGNKEGRMGKLFASGWWTRNVTVARVIFYRKITEWDPK